VDSILQEATDKIYLSHLPLFFYIYKIITAMPIKCKSKTTEKSCFITLSGSASLRTPTDFNQKKNNMNPITRTHLRRIFTLTSFVFFLNANAQTNVTTLAGSSTSGSANGTGAAAQFGELYGLTVDASGNVYVSDFYKSNIRKITPTGVVTTLAGHGIVGYVDGPLSEAYFSHPNGLAFDAAGNMYVADMSNCRIRKISSAGIVSTLAGSGAFAFADGVGASAQFYEPNDVAVDASGNVYVADTNNNRIRKITPEGVVTTYAGSTEGYANGPAATAKFYRPDAVAVDAAGNVYVAETTRIRKITAGGIVSTLAGNSIIGSADGTGSAAQFNGPLGLSTDPSGNIFVADTGNHCIRRITPAGVVNTWAGSTTLGFADGTGTAARFFVPRSVAADAFGNVYVADSYNYRIRKITGTLGTTDYQLENKIALYPNPAESAINIALGDNTVANVMIFDMNGRVLQTAIIVENNDPVNISHLANGVYLMQIATDKGIVRKKFVKR
jgi:serine/threonine-protein kinase